jgi:hypothetical protein
MKKLALTSVLLLVFGFIAISQPIPPDRPYLGQNPPGNVQKDLALVLTLLKAIG